MADRERDPQWIRADGRTLWAATIAGVVLLLKIVTGAR